MIPSRQNAGFVVTMENVRRETLSERLVGDVNDEMAISDGRSREVW